MGTLSPPMSRRTRSTVTSYAPGASEAAGVQVSTPGDVSATLPATAAPPRVTATAPLKSAPVGLTSVWNVTVTTAGAGPELPFAGLVDATTGSRQKRTALWMSGLDESSQAVDVSSTSIVPSVPPLTVTLRLVVPVMAPHHSTVSQLPRVYLYWTLVPSRTVIVASQMPPPLSVMRSLPGSHGPSWSMLPGRWTASPGGIPAGTRTRKVTATGRGWMLSSAGRDEREPSGLRYCAVASIAAFDAVPAGVTVKPAWNVAPGWSVLCVVADVA